MNDDINEMWAKDAPIDETNLVNESKRIPSLHSKYYNLYFREALLVKKYLADLAELKRDKFEYYTGSLDEQTMKEKGWKPFQLKVLRNETDKYMQSDKDIIKLSLKIDYHKERASYLEDIIKTIHSRNFVIKNIIDVMRFQSGDY
jgi:hypothetical protein